jgi:hypothetical protein
MTACLGRAWAGISLLLLMLMLLSCWCMMSCGLLGAGCTTEEAHGWFVFEACSRDSKDHECELDY